MDLAFRQPARSVLKPDLLLVPVSIRNITDAGQNMVRVVGKVL